MNNDMKYIVLNGDSVFAYIYENEKYGRTIVIVNSLDFSKDLKIYQRKEDGYTELLPDNLDFVEYIYSVLLIL